MNAEYERMPARLMAAATFSPLMRSVGCLLCLVGDRTGTRNCVDLLEVVQAPGTAVTRWASHGLALKRGLGGVWIECAGRFGIDRGLILR